MNLDEELKLQEQLDEANAAPKTEVDELIVSSEAKLDRWLKERLGKFTSSVLPNLMKSGKGKDAEWGDVSKKVLYGVKYALRTKLLCDQQEFWQMKHGKDNEPRAVEWLRNNHAAIEKICGGKVEKIEHCSEDFEDIEFLVPFDGFGDSPDVKITFTDGRIWRGEIKCPVGGEKIEMTLEEKSFHDKMEYFDQMCGHLIGDPNAEGVLFINYDAYADDAHLIPMWRKDVTTQVAAITERIKKAYAYVLLSIKDPEKYKISNINNHNFEDHV